MTFPIIITLCSLLLIAYVFDLTASKTRIPSVILLLALGWSVRQGTHFFEIELPDLSTVLPVFGTLGLILIVLEGSLELELNRSKVSVIRKSFLGVLLSMLALAFVFAAAFYYFEETSFRNSLINAIPFCVISSAIAIPSVRFLQSQFKEFIIYESSLSDIFSVLIFNFVTINVTFGWYSFGHFGLQLLIMSLVSVVAIIGLSFLLNKINHHIKFIPIILLVVLLYAVMHFYHLPALVFVLLFGLVLSNVDEIQEVKWIKRFRFAELSKEVVRFKELVVEAAFLIRAMFFLLFGYLMETAEILNEDTFVWALGIVAAIFLFRAIQLKLSVLPLNPLLFVAPRGLITILLFLSIAPGERILLVNKSLIIQVIVLSALIMMFGLMIARREKKQIPGMLTEPQTNSNDSSEEE